MDVVNSKHDCESFTFFWPNKKHFIKIEVKNKIQQKGYKKGEGGTNALSQIYLNSISKSKTQITIALQVLNFIKIKLEPPTYTTAEETQATTFTYLFGHFLKLKSRWLAYKFKFSTYG